MPHKQLAHSRHSERSPRSAGFAPRALRRGEESLCGLCFCPGPASLDAISAGVNTFVIPSAARDLLFAKVSGKSRFITQESTSGRKIDFLGRKFFCGIL